MTELTEGVIRALRDEFGVHLHIRDDGVVKAIQPGRVIESGMILAIRARDLPEAKRIYALRKVALQKPQTEIDALEDSNPGHWLELRKALRSCQDLTDYYSSTEWSNG